MHNFEKAKSKRKKKYRLWCICLTFGIVLIVFYKFYINAEFSTEQGNVLIQESLERLEEKSSSYFKTEIKSDKFNSFSGEKLIHLDLKGAPLQMDYLEELFPYLKGLGATGVLIEYEDMFPYSKALDKAKNAFTQEDIESLIEMANTDELQIIPLIQTFGHLEFLLKLEKFKDFREVPEYPQVICPTHVNTTILIRAMVDEVLRVHANAKYIHIGCDEVYYVGQCQRCKEMKKKRGWTDHHLLLNHIREVAKYIKEKHKGVRPIIWGDMLKNVDGKLIEKFEINDLVDIMVWHYTPVVSQHFNRSYFEKCSKYFKSIWIAGAFKGATGADQMVTDVNYHLSNLRSWMNIVSEWSDRITFKGICLTGWQRYDHFSVLCELFPLGLPSLIRQLQYLKKFDEIDDSETLNVLQCNGPLIYSPVELKEKISTMCNFPGFLLYKEITNFFVLTQNIKKNNPLLSSNGWFTSYNVLNKFSSPAQVKNFFGGFPLDYYIRELEIAEVNFNRFFPDVYDRYTMDEWISTNVFPLMVRLRCLSKCKKSLLNETAWARRPVIYPIKPQWTNIETINFKKELFCALIST